jgi:uncharacterized protein (DUF1697 family)
MPICISLLRAINLAKHDQIGMSELVEAIRGSTSTR